jgi:hypothetical protein
MSNVDVDISQNVRQWIVDHHDCLEPIAHYLAQAKANGRRVSSSALRYFVREELGVRTPSAYFAEIVAYIIAYRPRLAGVYGRGRKIQ